MPPLSRVGMHAPVIVQYFDAAAAGLQLNTYFWTADDSYEVVEVRANHSVNGGAGATVNVTICADGTLPAAGVDLITTPFVLSSGAATQQRKSASAGTLAAGKTILAGQSFAAEYAGTLTGLVGVVMTLVLRRIKYTTNR